MLGWAHIPPRKYYVTFFTLLEPQEPSPWSMNRYIEIIKWGGELSGCTDNFIGANPSSC